MAGPGPGLAPVTRVPEVISLTPLILPPFCDISTISNAFIHRNNFGFYLSVPIFSETTQELKQAERGGEGCHRLGPVFPGTGLRGAGAGGLDGGSILVKSYWRNVSLKESRRKTACQYLHRHRLTNRHFE